jgi:thiosulfate/3-mercaptopyruvate sulfurtransferase
MFAIVAGAAIQLPSAAAAAAGPRDTLLVSTSWLAEHLKDGNLVLLHVGDKGEYDTRHIPGARYVSLRDLSQPPVAEGSLTLEMLPAETLRDRLQGLGISDDSRVVVYYGKDWISPSTRVIFTLDYAGLDRVALLDGGMDAWTSEGHPVTDVAPEPKVGSLKPLTVRSTIVDAQFVGSHLGTPGFVVVDARDPEFYQGTKSGGGPQRPHKTGHIAGAVSVPFSSIVGDDLKIKNGGELTAAFEKAGVKPGDTVITYCHIGQQATATLFGARLLGHKVLLYDGSFEDWSRRDGKVETGDRR